MCDYMEEQQSELQALEAIYTNELTGEMINSLGIVILLLLKNIDYLIIQ